MPLLLSRKAGAGKTFLAAASQYEIRRWEELPRCCLSVENQALGGDLSREAGTGKTASLLLLLSMKTGAGKTFFAAASQ